MIFFDLFIARLASMVVLFLAVAYGVEGLYAFLGTLPVWVMTGLGKGKWYDDCCRFCNHHFYDLE